MERPPVRTYSVPSTSRKVEVFEESTLKASLWHGGERVADKFGYTDGYGYGYMVRNCLAETHRFAADYSVDKNSTLAIRFEHEANEVHVSEGGRDRAIHPIRRVTVLDLFGATPRTKLLKTPFETALAIEGGLFDDADVEASPCAIVDDLPDGSAWLGYGHEGISECRMSIFGGHLYARGFITLSVPETGWDERRLRGLWVRPDLTAPSLGAMRLRYIHHPHSTVFDLAASVPAASRWTALASALDEAVSNERTAA